ncbi:tRNA (adenosine(37)-N6)-threonylcarbamoyltransferase complex transferase subunit TsaD [Patescibacteria group bacterium]|nr:tRNA (adenosine(37)-N6)-threonylcarbamoyltransferase complex transferase subunit TsaD [Patescibacteria group bacterium]
MKILGLETSCDETAAATLQITNPKFPLDSLRPLGACRQISKLKIQILSNIVSSQIEIHQKYGGIVPEVAARQHVESIIPVLQEALGYKIQDTTNKIQTNLKSQIPNLKQISNPNPRFNRGQISKPDLIAVTQGPGLITSLQVGLQTAKTLSYVWNVPLIGVNHLEAHLWSFLLNQDTRYNQPFDRLRAYRQETNKLQTSNFKPQTLFPAIGLIVSGGHTEMALVKKIGQYKLIGRTRDDAAGEAFDKVAKLLGIGYPGGPIVSHFAKKGDPAKIDFPRPMIDSDDLDFSFSGLKTAVKYYLKDLIPSGSLSQAMINDICAGFQQAVTEVLVAKTIKAAQKFKVKSVIVGGGVSANEALIENLRLKTENLGITFYHPSKEFTQDNAAMVALAGYFKLKTASENNWQKLTAEPNLLLEY